MDNYYFNQPSAVTTAEPDASPAALAPDASSTVSLNDEDLIYEAPEELNLDDFQVVRREFFAHIHEPSITFNQCKFYVNAACLSKFPNTAYVQVMINRNTKILALRPCNEFTRDSFQWCGTPGANGKRKAKQTTCRIFFAKVVTMMGWNPKYRYKMLGKLIHANGEYLLVFDLTSTEVYQRTETEGEKPKTSRTPVYPEAWKNQFGMPYSEHKQSLQVDTFEGYAVYSIKDPAAEPHSKEAETVMSLPGAPHTDSVSVSAGDGGQIV